MNRKILFAALLTFVSLMMIATAVFADAKPGSPLSSWDDVFKGTGGWQNSNIIMKLPGDGYQPFLEQLSFDNDEIDSCGTGLTTKWAGSLQLQHMHEDNAPDGAIGFGATSDWMIVKCSLMDGNRYPPAEAILNTCSDTIVDPNDPYGSCELTSKDEEFPCAEGNCKTYWQTTVRGSLDQDCDGELDDPNFPVDDLCFYWVAEKPPEDTTWQQPLQSRITGGGGDKTVSFSDNFAPTAVSLVNFAASESPIGPSMGMVILLPLGLLGLAAAALLWRRAALD